MTSRGPQLKVELQRADVAGRVAADVVLQGAEFVRVLGTRSTPVLKAGSARRAADRAVLFQQGDAGDALLFILSGQVRLFARKDADTVELGLAHAGDVVGEWEVLAGHGPRQVTAVAAGVVEFVELPRALLLEGGALAPPLVSFLEGRRESRRKTLDDMTDFLNRW